MSCWLSLLLDAIHEDDAGAHERQEGRAVEPSTSRLRTWRRTALRSGALPSRERAAYELTGKAVRVRTGLVRFGGGGGRRPRRRR